MKTGKILPQSPSKDARKRGGKEGMAGRPLEGGGGIFGDEGWRDEARERGGEREREEEEEAERRRQDQFIKW